jgi:hypothetical protein
VFFIGDSREDEKILKSWKWKVLRKFFGPVNNHGAWRMCCNHELYNLYKCPDLVATLFKDKCPRLGMGVKKKQSRVSGEKLN